MSALGQQYNNRNLKLHLLNTNSDAGQQHHHLENNDNLDQSSFNPYISNDKRGGEEMSLDKILEFDQHNQSGIHNKRNIGGNLHFLSDNGRDRRRNYQIKKKVVLSPSKDEKGDYIETERGDKDESRRLKRVFFETYLGNSKDNLKPNSLAAPDVIASSIFDRDDSPTQHIEKRGRLMSVRASDDGKYVKRSILGSIDEYVKTTEQRQTQHVTVTTTEETGRSERRNRRNLGSQQVGSLMSAGTQKGANKRISNNKLGFSVDQAQNLGISQASNRVSPNIHMMAESHQFNGTQGGYGGTAFPSMMDTQKLLRSMNYKSPRSPEQDYRAMETYQSRKQLTSSISRFIKNKLHKKVSLIEQQENTGVRIEDIYMPNETNQGLPLFIKRKGEGLYLQDSVRGFYQNLRNGKQGCGVVYEPMNEKNSFTQLWVCQPSPKQITQNFKNEISKAVSHYSGQSINFKQSAFKSGFDFSSARASTNNRNVGIAAQHHLFQSGLSSQYNPSHLNK